ncbi:hypothetical protein [Rhizohabitans arisaemae]|uniref:hypothetical protein n=1 Tax=Rhizohabitans arisaemae TaxID=2720610 RepID=UPI0024B24564|nr:hypothetical protein [Rhizohabitans arisaemae]
MSLRATWEEPGMEMRKMWRVVLAVCGTFVLLGAQFVAAGPAGAVWGLVHVWSESAYDSTATKSRTTLCPAGKRVIGAGARVDPGNPMVSLVHVEPLYDGRGVTAIAHEDSVGYSANWLLTAYAICASPLAGYEVNWGLGASGTSPKVTGVVACSPGKRLLGFGGGVQAAPGAVVLTGVGPAPGVPDAVEVVGEETEGGYAPTWLVNAWAVCANPVPRLATVSESLPASSATWATDQVNCPAGTRMHGLGAKIHNGFGQVGLSWLQPGAGPRDPALLQATTLAFEDRTGLATDWTLETHLVCAS